MGHHMKDNMLNVRSALDALTVEENGVDGSTIYIYGEGWNFGEVADNARGVNATQFNMAGTGIGTFSDRLRDAVRGGGPFDGGDFLVSNQGFANGLFYDPNTLNSGSQAEWEKLLLSSDQIRVGMAGNLAEYQFIDRNGVLVTGSQVDYNGQPAGYTMDPQENISYISKHDNQTLYDNNAYKIPLVVSMEERVRIQNVGLSTVLLGQGVPFMHAGSDLLRSKSFDRDSFNSGDWFNKLDFTYQTNNFGVGLPVAGKNQDNWYLMGPRLADPSLNPEPADIQLSAALFQELLKIRASSELFHLETANEIQDRVSYHNTGPNQLPGLIVMSLSDLSTTDLDPLYEFIVVLVNANDEAQSFTDANLAGLELKLHAVQAKSEDAIVRTSSFNSSTGTFEIPGRTTAVFVMFESPEQLIIQLKADVQILVDNGDLPENKARPLFTKLDQALESLEEDKPEKAIIRMKQFVRLVVIRILQGHLDYKQGWTLINDAKIIIEQIRMTY
jgi:pullulanase-type alpha-1,6-glucosidase